MKKIILVFGFILLFNSTAFAGCDYSSYCAPEAYDLASSRYQTLSRITGMTFLSEKIAQGVIKNELKKATKERFNVKMESFSHLDLLGGRFKSLNITGKNLNFEGTYISHLNLQTACDFNYVELHKDSIKFKENMVMDFTMEVTGEDLRKTVHSAGYLDLLNSVNLSAFGITFFRLDGADVDIKNHNVFFTIKVTSPVSSKPLSVIVQSGLKVKNGQIVLTKMNLVNSLAVIDLSKAARILNEINPLTFSTEILDNKDSKIKISSVEIIENKVFIKGCILIPKNTVKKEGANEFVNGAK